MKSLQSIVCILLLCLAIPAMAADPIVAVWYQPVSSFAGWKARGVNTLMGVELEGGNVSVDQWCAAAQAAGLRYYLQRGTDSDRHAADANCVGWLLGDEPNGAGNKTPSQVRADNDAAKAICNKPVLVNLDGARLQWESDAELASYCSACDSVAFDYYILNRGEGPTNINKLGQGIDRIKRLAPGKPVILFIETSDQNLKVQDWAQTVTVYGKPADFMRGPTADEFVAEVQQAKDHGAAGIAYFSDIIGRNFEAFDGTPTAIVSIMPTLFAVAVNPSVPPAVVIPSTQPAPSLDGSTIIAPDGKVYRLTQLK